MKLKNFFILALILCCYISCGTSSKNTSYQSTISMRAGASGKTTWTDSLRFFRASWHQEATLVADLLFTPLSKDSPFTNWLGRDSSIFEECRAVYLSFIYIFDSSKISLKSIVGQITERGAKEIMLRSFHDAIKMHPEYSLRSLDIYKFQAFCAEREITSLEIDLPGLKTQQVYP